MSLTAFNQAVSKSGLSEDAFIKKNYLTAQALKDTYGLNLKEVSDLGSKVYTPFTYDADYVLARLPYPWNNEAQKWINQGYIPLEEGEAKGSKEQIVKFITGNIVQQGIPYNAIQGGSLSYNTGDPYNAFVAARNSTSPNKAVDLQNVIDRFNLTSDSLQKEGFSAKDIAGIYSGGVFGAGTKSPFTAATSATGSAPSVAQYSSGNTPARWADLYSNIQSGNLRLSLSPDAEFGQYVLKTPSGQLSTPATKVNDNTYLLRIGEGQYTTDFYVRADPNTGYIEPITSSQQINSYRHSTAGSGIGGFLEGMVSNIGALVKDLGPIGQLGLLYATGGLGSMIASELGISAAAGNALASAGLQVAQGYPLDQALANAATSYIGGSAGSAVNSLVDEVAAAQNYGTNLGSQQTAMLAAQDAGMGTIGDITGNIAGGTTGAATTAALKGTDVGTAALSGALGSTIPTVASTLAGATQVVTPPTTDQTQEPGIFADTTAPTYPEQPLASTIDQEQPNTPITIAPDGNVDAQGNPTYVNAQGNPVDINGTPIANANERTPIEGGGFKTVNPDGSVTYEDPDGSVYKVNADGTYTTQSMGQTNTYNPTTGTFTQPTTTPTTSTPSSGLSEQQISNILKAGTGLLTGAVVAPVIANALTGSGSTSTPTTTTTPSTGTNVSSALNPYNAAYFQQVQQNYNRLFPTAPADIATPLQSWYNTQYVPDTSISKKLFGV